MLNKGVVEQSHPESTRAMWSNLEVEVRWAPWRFSSWDTGFLADNFGSRLAWKKSKICRWISTRQTHQDKHANSFVYVESCKGFLWVLYVLEVIFQHDIWLGGRIISLVEICQLSLQNWSKCSSCSSWITCCIRFIGVIAGNFPVDVYTNGWLCFFFGCMDMNITMHELSTSYFYHPGCGWEFKWGFTWFLYYI